MCVSVYRCVCVCVYAEMCYRTAKLKLSNAFASLVVLSISLSRSQRIKSSHSI